MTSEPMTDTAELIARLRNAAGLKRDCTVCDGDGIKESGRPCGGCNETGSVLVYGGRVGEMMSEAADALSSLVRERDEALKVLRDHHKWHAESGILGIPDGDGGWIEMDNGAEYGDSRLYERTVEALRDMPPEFVVPPRGGWAMGSNHWENWQLAYRQKRAAEARATAAEADLEQTRAMYENLEASEVLAGYKNRLAAAEADAARMREALEAGGGTAVTEDGVVLTIHVSGSTLANAVKYMPKAEIFDEGLQDFFQPEVVDDAAFLKEMARALRHEEEDGTTLVHRMLDEAAIHIMHVGGDGVLSAQEVRDRARNALGGKDE